MSDVVHGPHFTFHFNSFPNFLHESTVTQVPSVYRVCKIVIKFCQTLSWSSVLLCVIKHLFFLLIQFNLLFKKYIRNVFVVHVYINTICDVIVVG